MFTLFPWFVPCREPVVAAYIADVPMVGVWDACEKGKRVKRKRR